MPDEPSTLRRTIVATALAGVVAAGCGGGDPTGAPAPSTSASSVQPSGPPVVDERYDVGGGRRLRMRCVGTGSPTVLLEAGGGSSAADWPVAITQPLAARTRTCAYDRAGTGDSDPAPARARVVDDLVADLDTLLAAAKIDGRVLLVGQSFGGAVALGWALRHPERIAGLVVVDTDWPTTDINRRTDRLLSAEQRAYEAAGNAWDAPDNTEHVDHVKIAAEIEAAVRPLPGIPIRILSATRSGDCDGEPGCEKLRALSVTLQKQWLKLSPTAVQVPVDGGHDLHEDASAVVLREIETALAAASP